IRARITAAASTKLAFQLFFIKNPVLVFIITTFLYWDWVICAPATFFKYSSYFLGSLSRIEP
ncbi:hypothetical protein K460DRAFT_298049, partial [Cucurbitaria berberidis CBS 394.84]